MILYYMLVIFDKDSSIILISYQHLVVLELPMLKDSYNINNQFIHLKVWIVFRFS